MANGVILTLLYINEFMVDAINDTATDFLSNTYTTEASQLMFTMLVIGAGLLLLAGLVCQLFSNAREMRTSHIRRKHDGEYDKEIERIFEKFRHDLESLIKESYDKIDCILDEASARMVQKCADLDEELQNYVGEEGDQIDEGEEDDSGYSSET